MDRSGRHRITRFVHSRNDKDMIAGWKSDLSRLLQVFNVCSTRFYSVTADFSLSPDRAYFEHSHSRHRYSPGGVGNPWGHWQSESSGKRQTQFLPLPNSYRPPSRFKIGQKLQLPVNLMSDLYLVCLVILLLPYQGSSSDAMN